MPGPAAAMRDAEGLVQVDVADVGAEIGDARVAGERVQVRAVEVDLAAGRVHRSQISRTDSSNTPWVEG